MYGFHGQSREFFLLSRNDNHIRFSNAFFQGAGEGHRTSKLGASHLSFNTMNVGLQGPDAHMEIAKQFMQAIGR